LLIHHLPMVVSAMYAEQGFAFAAPKPKPEPVMYFSGHFLHRHIAKIDDRIRQAITFGVRQHLAFGGTFDSLPPTLQAVLGAIQNYQDPVVQETLGVVAGQPPRSGRGPATRPACSLRQLAARQVIEQQQQTAARPLRAVSGLPA
jgi:hypothetical protein